MADKSLALYRAKRDFEKTAEPSGKTAISAARYPRFVIQKHAATRLHYDLRLELNGVFKSWAVTRGPSLDPADKRLAVEVEDHPLDYGDFEGTIPKGEYGGGTVMLWDRGFWVAEGDDDAESMLRKGDLKFILAGEKMQGSWVLVRMRQDRERGKRTNWLLIKHRDGFEHDRDGDALLGNDRSVASGRTMQQIAAGTGRGPKAFMTSRRNAADPRAIWHSSEASEPRDNVSPRVSAPKMIKNAKSKTIALPDFIPPQLCKVVPRPPVGDDWVHEIKFDGYRMQLRVENGVVALRTRKGFDWTSRFAATARAAHNLPDVIVDGEVVALDRNGAPDFAALQAALSEGQSDDLIYFAFDLLFDGREDLRGLPLVERKQRLEQLLVEHAAKQDAIRYVEHLSEAGDAILKSACRMNLEGIVSKRLSAPYSSSRSESWTKAKCRGGHEVVIGGWSGSKTTLRSLLVGVYRRDHLVHVGRVGTGFNSRNAPDLLAKLVKLATDRSPFGGHELPRDAPGINWVEPTLVAEIEFAGWTGTGMVRQAAFKGLREDKPAREVRAERPAPVSEIDIATTKPAMTKPAVIKAAMTKPGRGARSPESSSKSNVRPESGSPASASTVLGIVISKPEKALWPRTDSDAAITKLDLARYLETVGDWMLRHIEGRPCSVIRAPDGLAGEQFFQRHAMPGISNLVTLTNVSGDRKPYVQIDRPEALIAMAQIAAVEYHPWNCDPGHTDVPGRLVFDLDPGPDVPFDATIGAARELRQRLEDLGLVTFCKTTGGKGLHVVTPLQASGKRKLGWEEAKAFAQTVCSAMANDQPGRYLVNMSKKLRSGRIFLDYLRNDRMATTVAPLSPRLRQGAPVSMPLNWSQVKNGLDPLQYTLRTAPALLSKSKPWADYADGERPLVDAIRKLVDKQRG